ncbi:KLH11-like protein [Mya arenaria]|uniref:KLH11-like protein n=1 Tax=Mya arenaria TaxID=6604 RepID=A0ABY7F4W8_MYAAR|nr:uncharacterized protein LOC128206767 [Mya arenaria]WAR16424.1 KLH11-like protein [Mya arenaria]
MSVELQSKAPPAPSKVDNSIVMNQTVMEQLYKQSLEESDFCDITVSFGEGDHQRSMKAHSCVLVHSPYFQSMYRCGLREKQHGEVHIGIGKPEFVEMVLLYLYTGRIVIDYSTIKDLLEVVDYLQIDSLKVDCRRYLYDVELTVENCVSISNIASLYNLKPSPDVLNFIKAHLPYVLNQSESLLMLPDLVTAFLSDPTLSYVPREDLFNFLIKWIEFDSEKRTKNFESMFSALDLTYMTLPFLKRVVKSCKFVISSPKCFGKYSEAEQMLLNEDVDIYPTTDVFFLAWENDSNELAVDLYSIKENRWMPFPPLSGVKQESDIVCTLNCKGDELYAFKIFLEVDDPHPDGVMEFFKLNLQSKQWSTHYVKIADNDDLKSEMCIGGVLAIKETNEICLLITVYGNRRYHAVAYSIYYDDEMTHIISQTKIFRPLDQYCHLGLSCCLAEDRYICVYIYNVGRECNKFFVRDIKSISTNREFYDCSTGSSKGTVIFPVGNKIYLWDILSSSNSLGVFCLEDQEWSELDISKLYTRTDDGRILGVGFVEDKIFALTEKMFYDSVANCFMFDFKFMKWMRLAQPPNPLFIAKDGCSVLFAKLPSKYIPCHVGCPHCKYAASIKPPSERSESPSESSEWSEASETNEWDWDEGSD